VLSFRTIGRTISIMPTPTLVTKRLYFGVDAVRLRDATERVVTRAAGAPGNHAVVGYQTLAQEFGLGAAASRAAVDEMVKEGLLERLTPTGMDYAITDRFREYAKARLVQPLPRAEAQLLVSHFAELAEQFNLTASNNKYEIEAVAVFGDYMSLETNLTELSVGVTGRRRSLPPRPTAGRAMGPVQGTDQIRRLFMDQSGFVRVSFFHRVHDIPRPFSVIYKSAG